MNGIRRDFLKSFVKTLGAMSVIVVFPSSAKACLDGKWNVLCTNHHINHIATGACQQNCDQCGIPLFSNNTVTVVCKNGHPTPLSTGFVDGQGATEHYICSTCHTDCRLDS